MRNLMMNSFVLDINENTNSHCRLVRMAGVNLTLNNCYHLLKSEHQIYEISAVWIGSNGESEYPRRTYRGESLGEFWTALRAHAERLEAEALNAAERAARRAISKLMSLQNGREVAILILQGI